MTMLRTVGSFLRRCSLPGGAFALALLGLPLPALASELELEIPALDTTYHLFGASVSGMTLLLLGLGVCVLGMVFGLIMFRQVKALPAHQSMLDVSNIIYETCKTYLLQQG